LKTVKYGTTVLTGIIFFLLVSCDNFIHEIIPSNDNLITGFTLKEQSSKTLIDNKKNTITIPWNDGINLDGPPLVSVSSKASLLPVTEGYIKAAFFPGKDDDSSGEKVSDAIKQINAATDDSELTPILKKIVGDTRNFKMPSLDIPIDFTQPATFLVISGRDGKIRQYTANVTVKVTFVSNGGSEVGTVTVNYGETVLEPNPNPTKTNHGFVGWYEDEEFTGESYDFDLPVIKDTTLYAKWDHNICTVTFVSNGEIVDTQTVAHTGKAESPEDPERIGYIFGGWYEDEKFTGEGYNFDESVTDDITLYAKWTPITYIVLYNNPADETQTMPPSYHTYDEPGELNPNEFTCHGHEFAGWARDPDGAVERFTTKESIQNLIISNGGNPVTLYAVWGGLLYYVEFHANDGSGRIKLVSFSLGVKYKLTKEFEREGYEFTGWEWTEKGDFFSEGAEVSDMTTAGDTVKLYAQWIRILCTVTFDKNNTDADGTDANPQTIPVALGEKIEALPEEEPIRPDWNFDHWNTKADGSGEVFNEDYTVQENMTVYAQWWCTVTFDKNNNDANCSEAVERTITVTTPETNVGQLPAPPVWSGIWTGQIFFNGWNTKRDGSGTAFTATTTVPGNITVYAQWIGPGIPWFIDFRADDDAPLIEPIIISHTGNPYQGTLTGVTTGVSYPKTATITVVNHIDYTGDIVWKIHGTSVIETGPSIILNVANAYYNNIGYHYLTVYGVSIKDGKTYSRTITFIVVE
jgi:uncharacterized repeat protein (TIGR02543 family)